MAWRGLIWGEDGLMFTQRRIVDTMCRVLGMDWLVKGEIREGGRGKKTLSTLNSHDTGANPDRLQSVDIILYCNLSVFVDLGCVLGMMQNQPGFDYFFSCPFSESRIIQFCTSPILCLYDVVPM